MAREGTAQWSRRDYQSPRNTSHLAVRLGSMSDDTDKSHHEEVLPNPQLQKGVVVVALLALWKHNCK